MVQVLYSNFIFLFFKSLQELFYDLDTSENLDCFLVEVTIPVGGREF